MERIGRSLVLAALVLVTTALARPGRAEPAPDDAADSEASAATENPPSSAAQDLFWEASREYQEGNYGRAAELFEQLYALVPESEVVFNIALATAKSGQCERAKARFAEYTAQVSDAAVREQATLKFSEVIESCKEPGAPAVSARAAPTASEPADSQQVRESKSTSSEPPPVAVEKHGWSGQRIAGWALVSAAVGAAGVTVYFETERQAARSQAAQAETPQEYAEFAADYEHARNLEMVSFGAAVGLAGLGVTLLLLDTDGDPSLSVGVGMDRAAAPSCGSVRLTGSF